MEGRASATKRGKRNEDILEEIYILNVSVYAGFLLAKLHCAQEIYTRFLPVSM